MSIPEPVRRMYVNDGNMIAMILAVGADDQVAGISSLQDDADALAIAYGQKRVDALPVATKDYPTLENVLAQKPDLMFAGWSYGFRVEENLTPDRLADHGIASYILSESCRQDDGDARGTMPPWKALYADLANLGKITGHQKEANAVVADIKERLDTLESAPQASTPPTVFLFDSGTKDIISSGSLGGPQAVIEAAGGRNALEDLDDTWTSVSWERLVAAKPDFIAFVDYPGQSFQDKVQVLRTNPATKNLPAVKQGRFLNLPYAAWTSSPLNIDAAESLRHALEKYGLVPDSGVEPERDLRP